DLESMKIQIFKWVDSRYVAIHKVPNLAGFLLLVCVTACATACGAEATSNSDTTAGETSDGASETSDGTSATDGCGAAGPGGDEPDYELIPRNVDEVVIPGGPFHPTGRDLIGVMSLPPDASCEAPVPGCVVMHGSGGLFREEELGDVCSEEVESKFRELMDVMRANGVAAIAPASFYSRDSRFCEDNSSFIDYAPPGYNRKEHRTAIRTYDLLATTRYFCQRKEVDCDRLCFIGTSNGGSIIFHYLHQHLDDSFATFFADEADEIGEVPYVAMPKDRPMPRFAQAISPGCGLNGAIGLEVDDGELQEADIRELYYPALGSQLYMDLGTDDGVPDDCAIELGEGRREIQALEVESRLGITAEQSRYNYTIYPDGEHDLLGQEPFGDQIRAAFVERLGSL
ncbi:MAG: hypothetical protein ACPG4T_23450, partial [Nannocystaceae bacterium]